MLIGLTNFRSGGANEVHNELNINNIPSPVCRVPRDYKLFRSNKHFHLSLPWLLAVGCWLSGKEKKEKKRGKKI